MDHKHTEPQRRAALLAGLKHLGFWISVQLGSEDSITSILKALRLRVRLLEEKVVAAGSRVQPTSSNTTQVNLLSFRD